MERDELTSKILGVAFRIHTVLGPGLLESVYEVALTHKLQKAGLLVATQVEMPVVYDGIRPDLAFRADMVVGWSCTCNAGRYFYKKKPDDL